jgi:hypothetical protein
MSIEKENFLRTKLIICLQRIDPATAASWGKMSVQQMIEHYAHDAVANASGKLKIDHMITPPEQLQRLREFMLSEKPLRENILNPLMPEEPGPVRYKTVQAAIGALQEELIYFFEAFEKDPDLITQNPFFGPLNFAENVHLLHKHAMHHLRQFNAEPPGF